MGGFMKKIMIVLTCILMVGCSSQKYTDHLEVTEYVLHEALNLEFDDFNNLTATSGDLKITMRDRLEIFEPYLTQDAHESFENRETYWYGVWEVSGRQIDLYSDQLELVLEEDKEKSKTYVFKTNVYLSFIDTDLVIDRVQEGEVKLILKGNKWQVDQLKYTNDVFRDIQWP